jgi:chromosomal replication initiator protein
MTPRRICNAVARYYGLAFRDLRARTRVALFAEARRVACYLLRTLTNLSFPQIGLYLRRDHSTVISACRSVARRLARWPDGPTADAVAVARMALA